jgi:methionyl-tRNA synthetase
MSKPWDKVLVYGPGEPGEDVDRIVYLAAEALRITGILLLPYEQGKNATRPVGRTSRSENL